MICSSKLGKKVEKLKSIKFEIRKKKKKPKKVNILNILIKMILILYLLLRNYHISRVIVPMYSMYSNPLFL